MTSILKNVIVVNDYDYVQGGASKIAIETANLFASKGYNVIFFCGVSNFDKTTLDSNVSILSCEKKDALSKKSFLKGLFNNNAKKTFMKLLQKFNPKETIIHIHGWTKSLTSSIIIPCQKYNFKTVLTVHDYFLICQNGGLFNYKENRICTKKPFSFKCCFCNCDSRNYLFKIYRNIRFLIQNRIIKFQRKIDSFITISDLSESIIKKELNNELNLKGIYRVYNYIDIEKKEISNHSISNYYLYVGRIDKEKGVDNLCRVFCDLPNENLILIGTGNEFDRITDKYKSPNITFLGWQDHKNVEKYMNTAKALIFPSIWYEGAPLTILEAMAKGLFCIVSNKCSAVEFIDNNCGFIYDPYDENDLKNIILSISSKTIEEKSNNTYLKYWSNPFNKERYFNELLYVYEKTITKV